MFTHAATHQPLVHQLFGAATRSILGRAVLVLLGSALLAASAQLRISLAFSPVPITMQSAAVLIIAAAFGRQLGVATILAYLAEGAAGLPVFAGGHGGIAHLVGPTGGYLMGFIAAAWIVGTLAERGWDRDERILVAMALGTAAIFACGLAWLWLFVPTAMLLTTGLIPFLPGALLKGLIAAGVLPPSRAIARRFAD